MEGLSARDFWLIIAAVAAVFYWLGRRAGGETRAEREERRAGERGEAAKALGTLPSATRAQIDELITTRELIAAIKLIRAATGLDLKGAKDAADQRLAELRGTSSQ